MMMASHPVRQSNHWRIIMTKPVIVTELKTEDREMSVEELDQVSGSAPLNPQPLPPAPPHPEEIRPWG
jgi:hypothetical protein